MTEEPVDFIQRVHNWMFDVREVSAISDLEALHLAEYYDIQFLHVRFEVVLKIPNIQLKMEARLMADIDKDNYNFCNPDLTNYTEIRQLHKVNTQIKKAVDFIHFNRRTSTFYFEQQEGKRVGRILTKNNVVPTELFLNQYNQLCIAWEYYKRKQTT